MDSAIVRNSLRFLVLLLTVAQWANAAPEIHADKVVLLKGKRTLILYRNENILRSYKISLGSNPLGPKTRQGDGRTPEGNYILDRRNPKSQFYRSIHVSYPNAGDRERARKSGVNPGGDIFVHGLPNGYGAIGRMHLAHDWTNGCIAVTNEEMDEIWKLVPDGTPIEIRP
jgi:murein L,D-transpeptidase YafK